MPGGHPRAMKMDFAVRVTVKVRRAVWAKGKGYG